MPVAVIGLGSNIGTRLTHLQHAVRALKQGLGHVRCSQLVESKALLKEGAPQDWDRPFLNMAVCGETTLAPLALLDYLQEIERSLGRVREAVWAPRVIDLDILAYGEGRVQHPDMDIPHRELLHRDFALWPLAELWPDWRYPCPGDYEGMTAKELTQRCCPHPAFLSTNLSLAL